MGTFERVKAMMADDPRMIRIRSQTRGDITKSLIKLGVLTPDGEIAQSYLDKFEKPSMTEKFGGVSTFDRAKAMMENDPRMIRIRSQTREDIMKSLIKLGVLTSDGEIAQSYIDQFKENGSSYGSLSE